MLNSFDDETIAPSSSFVLTIQRAYRASTTSQRRNDLLTCFYGNYRAWGRIIAANCVAVAMVDFRNALVPSSVPEVAPFPQALMIVFPA